MQIKIKKENLKIVVIVVFAFLLGTMTGNFINRQRAIQANKLSEREQYIVDNFPNVVLNEQTVSASDDSLAMLNELSADRQQVVFDYFDLVAEINNNIENEEDKYKFITIDDAVNWIKDNDANFIKEGVDALHTNCAKYNDEEPSVDSDSDYSYEKILAYDLGLWSYLLYQNPRWYSEENLITVLESGVGNEYNVIYTIYDKGNETYQVNKDYKIIINDYADIIVQIAKINDDYTYTSDEPITYHIHGDTGGHSFNDVQYIYFQTTKYYDFNKDDQKYDVISMFGQTITNIEDYIVYLEETQDAKFPKEGYKQLWKYYLEYQELLKNPNSFEE